MKNSREFRGFKQVHNQMLAHRQVVTKTGAIKPPDLARLRLKFGDERKLLEVTRTIAEDLNSVVRGASFSWDAYLETEARDVCGFWEIDSIDGPVSI